MVKLGALSSWQKWNQLRISARGALEVGGVLTGCNGEASKSDCRSVIDWFKYAASSLESGVDNERWRTFLYQNAAIDPIELSKLPGAPGIPQFPHWDFAPLPKSAPPEDVEFAQDLLVRMHTLDDLRTEVLAIEAQANVKWYDLLVRSAVPWFLTIALALRITKNSVDYLKVTESKKGRCAQIEDERSTTTSTLGNSAPKENRSEAGSSSGSAEGEVNQVPRAER
jgi:hypothetical protein